jgi:hypothetical protein
MSIALRTNRSIGAVAVLAAATAFATILTLPGTRTQARAQTPPTAEAPAPPDAAPRPNHGSGRRASQRSPHAAAGGTVIQGADTSTLVASLPWWRIDGPLAPAPDPGQDESQILTACDLWLGFPHATADADSLTVRLAAAQHASELESAVNRILVADPNEPNEIDLAAPQAQPGHSWWLGVLAGLAGALAAAALAGYLIIIRSRRPPVPSVEANAVG